MPTPHINAEGVQYVRDHLATLPRPDRDAKRAIKGWLATQGVNLDPDQIDVVTLHLHPHDIDGYQAVVMQRVSLTQAVLMNWQGESNNDFFGALFKAPWAGTLPEDGPITLVAQLPPQPIYDNGAWYEVFNGLFRRTDPALYDQSTLLNIRADELQRHIEALDFHTAYKTSLDTYWHQHLASYRLCCKLNFIATCNQQVSAGRLSDAARKLAWRAAELIPRGKGLRLSTLSIYGYAATDLLYIHDVNSQLTLLYAPGNSSPLLEFANENLLKDWVGQQCKDAAKRQALKQHFRMADGPRVSISAAWTLLWKGWAFIHATTGCRQSMVSSMTMALGRPAPTSITGQPSTTRESPATCFRPWPSASANVAMTMPTSSSPATAK